MTVRTLALSLATLSCAAPLSAAAAQYGGSAGQQPAPEANRDMSQGIPAQAQATSTTGRKYVVSSKNAEKAILALQNAVNLKETVKIPGLLAEAQKVAKTPDEKFLVAAQQTRAALDANDPVAIAAGTDAMQASGVADSADIAARYTDLGIRYGQAKRIDEAVAVLNKALALNPNSIPALITLAGIRDAQGQKAEAVALMQKGFIASKAAGVKVDEGNYKFATGLAYGQRLPAANDLARQWYAAYPSPASLRDSMRIYRDLNKPAPGQLIDLLRLGRAANALSGETDYAALASALVNAGKTAEAKSLLAEARTAPGIDLTKNTFVDLAKRTAAAPARAAIDASAKAAMAGANGKAMIDAGDALYGVGAYAEAVPLYRAALTKGGDAGLANLHLGMALARSGDKAGATAALNAVTGANAEIARYWLLWLATRP